MTGFYQTHQGAADTQTWSLDEGTPQCEFLVRLRKPSIVFAFVVPLNMWKCERMRVMDFTFNRYRTDMSAM